MGLLHDRFFHEFPGASTFQPSKATHGPFVARHLIFLVLRASSGRVRHFVQHVEPFAINACTLYQVCRHHHRQSLAPSRRSTVSDDAIYDQCRSPTARPRHSTTCASSTTCPRDKRSCARTPTRKKLLSWTKRPRRSCKRRNARTLRTLSLSMRDDNGSLDAGQGSKTYI